MSEEENGVYAAPETDVEAEPTCPKCHELMADGHLSSNSRITWVGATLSGFRKAVFGGEVLPLKRSGLGCKYTANYCKACQLFILID